MSSLSSSGIKVSYLRSLQSHVAVAVADNAHDKVNVERRSQRSELADGLSIFPIVLLKATK